jgi:hypothetical protein
MVNNMGFIILGIIVAWLLVITVLGVWYIKKSQAFAKEVVTNVKTHGGRLITVEGTVRNQNEQLNRMDEISSTLFRKSEETNTLVQKAASLAGQVPALQKLVAKQDKDLGHLAHDLGVGTLGAAEDYCRLDSELKALAKELGYEINTTAHETVSTVSRIAAPKRVRKNS